MKNLLKIALLAFAFYGQNVLAVNNEDKILATYKNGNVTTAEVIEQFKMLLDSNPELKGKKFGDLNPGMQEAMVKMYINGKLLDEEIKKSKIEESKEFIEKLDASKKQLAQAEFIEKIINEKVTNKLIDDEYAALEKEMKNQEKVTKFC